ncbi:YveK family protein [Bacillus massilinigeriensis]|uniref:YveK family protein n=1 Tax=Bacillus massilionigeriensis TaxID=1805475 RepID=UPI00096AFFA9|nr:Wzz/FepE/Etk N-terminal domain-containing protein [Bacillus massilionigeriensis]
MDDTFSLSDIFLVFKKRWKLILLITSLAMLVSGGISFYLMTPIYQSSTQILVNQKNSQNQVDITQLRSNIDLINTYSVIIKSPAILETVIKELELPDSVDQLNQKISVSSQENSQIFLVTVQDTNPGMAVEIANTVSETFQRDIQGIMNVDNVSILAKAELKKNPMPIKPNPILNIGIAMIIGLLAGMGLAILLDYLDNSLKNGDDVEKYIGLPVLGSIQNVGQLKGKKNLATQNSMGVQSFET